MKKITFLAAIAVVFMLASCDKSKDCKCITTQKWDLEEGMGGTAEQTVKIDKGECSDLDNEASMTMGGQHYTQITKCTEL